MTANFIRVRLNFDYAPPAVVGCRMCWLLVDLRSCRVVADLEGTIRDKFELSRGSILSLFIEDCYLPHTESILVVRDNDCVRVKVDNVSTTPTAPEATAENKRKRQRPAEDEGSVENSSSLEFKKKKRKRSVVESPAVNGLQTEIERTDTNLTKKVKDKKRQKEEKPKAKSTPPPVKASPSVKKSAKNTQKILTTTTSATTKKPQSSSSSTSSSEDEAPVRKIPAPKPVSKPALNSTLASPKTIQNGRPPSKKLPPPSSSSSLDSSSEEEDKTTKAKMTNDKSKLGDASQRSTNNVFQNGGDDSEEEIQLVIKKPVQHPHGRIVVGQTWQQGGGESGRGRGKPEPRETWGKGRGRGGNYIQYNYQEKERGKKEPAYSTDSLTNVSVVLQNEQNGPSLPKPDYSTMPLLAAPPQVGQKIAFKLLELTENYTPEVSDYKEAKILSFDLNTKQIELELLTSSQAPVEPGKFDLVYQNPDGSESVEYAVDRGSLVTERWDSLLEPRLVI